MTLSDEQRKQIISWAQANAGTENETFNEERYCGLIDGATRYCQQKDEEIARLRYVLEWYADPGNYLDENSNLATAWKMNENIANKAKEALKK